MGSFPLGALGVRLTRGASLVVSRTEAYPTTRLINRSADFGPISVARR
jgi:hypothetical protein